MNDSTTPKINFPLIFAIIAFCSLIVLIVVFFFQRQINRLKKASALEKGGFQNLIHQANEENRRLNQEIERQSNSTPAL